MREELAKAREALKDKLTSGDPESVEENLALQWYNHEEEPVRLLRYFVRDDLPRGTVLAPNYPKKPKIGAVISTYGSVPYVDLNLHCLAKVNHLPVLVHDDCSPERDRLIKVCGGYPGVQYYSTKKRRWHHAKVGAEGDTSSFLVGLIWAKDHKLDILLKLSRRMVAVSEFAPQLAELALATDGGTFGSRCPRDGFPIRTECMAMSVNVWGNDFTMRCLVAALECHYPIFSEFWFQDMARTLSPAIRSTKYLEFMDKQRGELGVNFDSFVKWDFLAGSSRYDKNPHALWHSANPVEDYLEASRQVFGDRYTKADFEKFEDF